MVSFPNLDCITFSLPSCRLDPTLKQHPHPFSTPWICHVSGFHCIPGHEAVITKKSSTAGLDFCSDCNQLCTLHCCFFRGIGGPSWTSHPPGSDHLRHWTDFSFRSNTTFAWDSDDDHRNVVLNLCFLRRACSRYHCMEGSFV